MMKAGGARLFGLQTWAALPAALEEIDPAFLHTGEDELPVIEDSGSRVRLMVGKARGRASPIKTSSDTIYADVALEPGGSACGRCGP